MPLRPPEFEADPASPFEHDRLDRQGRVKTLCRVLTDEPGPAVVSANGGFGTGKTSCVAQDPPHRGGSGGLIVVAGSPCGMRWWLSRRPSVAVSKIHSLTGQRCPVSGGSGFGPSHVIERFQRGAPRGRLGGWRIKILAVVSRAIVMEEVVILEVSEGDCVV